MKTPLDSQTKNKKKQQVNGAPKVKISRKRDKKFTAKFLVPALPHPFKSAAQYERQMDLPLGREWNTATVHQKLNQPAIKVDAGKVINPMRAL